jgi:hypothetical protein
VPIFNELYNFLPKKLLLSSQKYGFGIRDPRSGKNLFRIPDPGVKKAPDPGSGSATLDMIKIIFHPSLLLLFLDPDPGWIKSESGIIITDPQHC